MGQEQFGKGNVWASAKEAGIWKDVPFNASNFYCIGAMTWTILSSDIQTNRYCRIGNMIIWTLFLVNSTLGGTLNTTLLIIPPTPNKIARISSSVAHGYNGGIHQIFPVRINPQNVGTDANIGIGRAPNANFAAGVLQFHLVAIYEYGDSVLI